MNSQLTATKVSNLLKKAGMTKSENILAGFTSGFRAEMNGTSLTVRYILSTSTANGLTEIGKSNAVKAGLRTALVALKGAGIEADVTTDSTGIYLTIK